MAESVALELEIIDFDGTRTHRTLTSTQVKSGQSVFQISPSQIVLAEIHDESLECSQVGQLFTLGLGDFDVFETINQDARYELDPADEFGNWDDWYESNLNDLEFSRRFIRISKGDDQQWLWLLNVSADQKVPVLVDAFGFAGAKKIAAHTWFSESDVPISWSGGADLFQLSEDLYLESVYGDSPVEPTLTHTDGGDSELLDLIEDFCLDEMRVADAAIAFEASKIQGLNDEAQLAVEAHLERYYEYASFSLDLTSDLVEQLKIRLEQKSAIYRRLKGFFEDPMAPQNADILAAFQELSDTGYTGSVNGSSPDWV